MSSTITVKALAQETRRLAQEFPNHVAVCSYTRYEDDELVPNCIVGTAAYNLGISLDDLRKVNTCGIRQLSAYSTPEWLDVSADDSKTFVDWLSTLQIRQDGGGTWSEALRAADRHLVATKFNI